MKRLNNLYYNNLSYSILKCEYETVKSNCRHGRKLVNFANFLNSNIYEILKDLYNQQYTLNLNETFLKNDKQYLKSFFFMNLLIYMIPVIYVNMNFKNIYILCKYTQKFMRLKSRWTYC